jgi:hypothetical protein
MRLAESDDFRHGNECTISAPFSKQEKWWRKRAIISSQHGSSIMHTSSQEGRVTKDPHTYSYIYIYSSASNRFYYTRCFLSAKGSTLFQAASLTVGISWGKLLKFMTTMNRRRVIKSIESTNCIKHSHSLPVSSTLFLLRKEQPVRNDMILFELMD